MASVAIEIPACSPQSPTLASIVSDGLSATCKHLPPWLFYDDAGSELFDQITTLPEYYLTRIERGIFAAHALQMIAAAGSRLRVLELGAGSADKTRTLLAAACAHQGSVCYHPIDVSASALDAARHRLRQELPAVAVEPLVADYTRGLDLEPSPPGERRLALFIGSSIGNFAPPDALALLTGLRNALHSGDSLLLGVDLAPPVAPALRSKTLPTLLAAYDDPQGITAAFNQNLLVRLNRELGANFQLDAFRHQVRWNSEHSRIEMHLESRRLQSVTIPALDRSFDFIQGETIHTENSYKYRTGQAEALLRASGFEPEQRWTDADQWFAVHLARKP